MSRCESCEDVEGRMMRWIDHVNCTPLKYQRYDLMLSFVKMVAAETAAEHSEKSMKECLSWLNLSANNLLKELEEYEILRSNGLAKSGKECNP